MGVSIPHHSMLRVLLLVAATSLGLLLPGALAFEELPTDFDTSTLDEDQLEDIEGLISSSWYYLAELQELAQVRPSSGTAPDAWKAVTEGMLLEIQQKQDFIFEAGETDDSWGPPPGLEDWWHDGVALWQWLDTTGTEAYLHYWQYHAGQLIMQELTLPNISLFKEMYYEKAASIEAHIKQAWEAHEGDDGKKFNAAMIRLRSDRCEADALESLITSNLEDATHHEEIMERVNKSPKPAEMFESWQISSADHPIFGAARDAWVQDSREIWDAYDELYRDVVEELNPLRGDSLLQRDGYKHMWGWKKDEIRTSLDAEIGKLEQD
jgi:hypothetical protein